MTKQMLTLRLTSDEYREIAKAARKDGVSMNKWCVALLLKEANAESSKENAEEQGYVYG